MQQLDFSRFQPLNGFIPVRLVSVHLTEPFVALQAFLEVLHPLGDGRANWKERRKTRACSSLNLVRENKPKDRRNKPCPIIRVSPRDRDRDPIRSVLCASETSQKGRGVSGTQGLLHAYVVPLVGQ